MTPLRVGKRIKLKREKADLSQSGLAKKIGASQGDVSRIERGKLGGEVTRKHLLSISRFLHLPKSILPKAPPEDSRGVSMNGTKAGPTIGKPSKTKKRARVVHPPTMTDAVNSKTVVFSVPAAGVSNEGKFSGTISVTVDSIKGLSTLARALTRL